MTIKHDILSVLEKTKFPKNTGRKNNLHKGQTHSLSMVLGTVKMLFGRGLAESKHNKKHPELLELAKKLLASHDPKYKFEAVTINKNHAAAKHVDRNNSGHSYIIGLGDYTGGELVFEKGPYEGSHNLKNRWLKFKGDTPHYVEPFTGTRYTLVYYHWK
jgi:hypothetical protein